MVLLGFPYVFAVMIMVLHQSVGALIDMTGEDASLDNILLEFVCNAR